MYIYIYTYHADPPPPSPKQEAQIQGPEAPTFRGVGGNVHETSGESAGALGFRVLGFRI